MESEDGRVDRELALREYFNRPDVLEGGLDSILNGMVKESAQDAVDYFVDDINHFLLKGTRPVGDDLGALTIQRGRDHGLPSYNQLRQLIGLKRAYKFSDFEDIMEREAVEKLERLYEHVDDVDLFVGQLYERKYEKTLLGPTCQTVVEEQFRRWKYGDRFWFEHENEAGSLSRELLEGVREVTLASLLCENSDITSIQRYAFWKVDAWNPIYPCKQIKAIHFPEVE